MYVYNITQVYAFVFQKEEKLPLGAILHVKGINRETTREDIKERFIQEGLDVAYVDFNKDSDEAWIRLLGENSSKNVSVAKNLYLLIIIVTY